MGVSKKQILTLFKIAKGSKFALKCVSNGIVSLKGFSRPSYEIFGQKVKKN